MTPTRCFILFLFVASIAVGLNDLQWIIYWIFQHEFFVVVIFRFNFLVFFLNSHLWENICVFPSCFFRKNNWHYVFSWTWAVITAWKYLPHIQSYFFSAGVNEFSRLMSVDNIIKKKSQQKSTKKRETEKERRQNKYNKFELFSNHLSINIFGIDVHINT